MDDEVLGPGLQKLLRWLCIQSDAVALWRNIAWRALHGGWVDPHRQHDVIEYLSYLRPMLGARIRAGTWQSRQVFDGRPLLLDAGNTWPLLLPATLRELAAQTTGPLSLQHLVDEWMHSQAGLHGLLTAPDALLVQINRFLVVPEGTLKVDSPVYPGPYIQLPCFENSLDHQFPLALQYRKYNSILHLGQSPDSGHYRAILYDDSLGSIITDDNRTACKLSESQASAQAGLLYAFLYRLCDVH